MPDRIPCSPRLVRVLVLAVAGTVPAALIAQAPPPRNPLASVDAVRIVADPARGELPCPAMIRLEGTIQVSTPGIVRYRLRTSDGEVTPYHTVSMPRGERRQVVHLHQIGDAAQRSASGTAQLEVVGAAGTRTADAAYRITCAAARGTTGVTAMLGATVRGEGGLQGQERGENLRERLSLYLRRRGYSSDSTRDSARANAYQRLTRMRVLQRRRHVTRGWLPPGGKDTIPAGAPGAPGVVDASQCAWSSIGPTNINGRVTQIAIDPTNNQRLLAATVGGIWRSADGARRWQRVSDDFLSTVFASAAFNPATPTEVFIGAGDPNYHGAWKGGIGIWRSTSSGDPGTWTKVSPVELDGHVIYRIRVDPAAPNNVYAATSRGVYLGTRTGPTITFARLAAFDAWTNDVAVDFSVTPRLVYAGVRSASATFARGIWKYDGTTWNQRNTGIPTTNSRTIVLALAPSAPATLYAKVEVDDGHSQGVYKTTTAGEAVAPAVAWTATGSALDDSCASFCYSWYNSTLEVDPANANIVWGGGLGIHRTANGGTTWTNVSGGTDASYPMGVHADHHAVAFDPSNTKIVYVGDDGGIFRTSNTAAATWRWNKVSHGMLLTEYYRSTSQQASAGIAAGGTQDNGTVVTFGNRTWYQPGGCDGSDVAIDAANASTLYGNCNGGLFELANPVPGTVGGGSTIAWSVPAGVSIASPLVSDPGVAGAALAGGITTVAMVDTWRLYRTTDGVNWASASVALPASATITTIAIAPSSMFQTYYMGVSDGTIWRTTNSGTMWTQASTGLPGGVWVNGIAVDHSNAARAVAATSAGVFLTTNTGADWTAIAGTGIGALPTSAITGAVFDPNDVNRVFLATDVGAFRGTITPAAGPTPASAAWAPFDEGLPDGLDINDIWVNRVTGTLKIGTMGHGAYQRDIRPGITCPGAQTLVRDNVHDRGVTPSPSGVPDPEHPIPDPARPGFFKPDDTSAGRVYWWKSTDVRIDVPASAPAKNQITAADHVEVESCPILLADCPAGTILDQFPQRGRTARVYAQVGNVGLQPATTVRVVALYADASAGLPNLPNDFWTTTFPAGGGACGALNSGTGWHFADAASPCKTISVVNPDMPETASFAWAVPLTQAQHSCMLIITETASDPLDPAIRSSNQLAIAQLVPNNRQISLRNLHVIDATVPAGGGGGGGGGGEPQGMEPMNVSNLSRELRYVELVVSRVDFPRNSMIGLLLPTTRNVQVRGAALSRPTLSARQTRAAAQMKLSSTAFYRITDTLEGTLRLPIPPGETWQVAIAYDRAPAKASRQWSVLARQGNQIIGGNTYIIRPAAPGIH